MALTDAERALLDGLVGQTIAAVAFSSRRDGKWDSAYDSLTLTLSGGFVVELTTWDAEAYASGLRIQSAKER